jgi:hypothetical protein
LIFVTVEKWVYFHSYRCVSLFSSNEEITFSPTLVLLTFCSFSLCVWFLCQLHVCQRLLSNIRDTI